MLTDFVKRTRQGNAPNKDRIRTLTISFMQQFFLSHELKTVRLLTLPSAWWLFEHELRHKFRTTPGCRIAPYFTGCEKDYKLFCLASLKLPIKKKNLSNFKRPIKQKLNDEFNCQVMTNGDDFNLFHLDVFDFMNGSNKKFNGSWLDLCCPVDMIGEKLGSLRNIIDYAKPFVLAITVLKGRERKALEVERTDFISTALLSVGNFEKAYSWEYFDTSPMLHVIYTLNPTPF